MTDDELIKMFVESSQHSPGEDIEWDRLIALARIGASVMPRPIEEAPKDDLVERLNKRISLLLEIGEKQMADDLKQAATRISALEEALRPFADAYVNREEWALDSYIGGSNLRNRDLRRAARCFAEGKEKPDVKNSA